MDQTSSSRVAGSSTVTTIKTKSDDGIASTSKNNLSFDDSNSVSSMSTATTATRETKCYICKGTGNFLKPLIPCMECKRRFHQHCPRPYIQDHRAPYTCDKCQQLADRQARPKIDSAFKDAQLPRQPPIQQSCPYAPSNAMNATSGRPKSKPNLEQIPCAVVGCKKSILFAPTGTRPLCLEHKNLERYASAKAAPAKPPPVRNPIQKGKLYPLKDDDRQFLTRRRRVERSSGSTGSNEAGGGSRISFAFRAEGSSESTFTPSNMGSNAPRLPSIPSRKSHVQQGNQFPNLSGLNAGSTDNDLLIDDTNQSLGSASMVESIMESIAGKSRRSDSARVGTTQTSPAYSPPPPQIDVNPWVDPASAIEESSINATYSSATPGMGRQISGDEDEEMLDAAFTDLVEELAPHHPCSLPRSPSPVIDNPSPTYSANAPSDEDDMQVMPSNTAPEAAPEITTLTDSSSSSAPPPPPNPNEVGHFFTELTSRAVKFEPSELDSYLLEQAQFDSDARPTNQELLNTQTWGHIDPRVTWERKLSPEEIKEKIKEIEARGGKKANYGKLLTAQVRKERTEKGWNIHQRGDRRTDTECLEYLERMEELFQVPNIGNYVPGMRDNRLVMIEQLEPEEPQTGPGRRKKKKEPNILPVLGAL